MNPETLLVQDAGHRSGAVRPDDFSMAHHESDNRTSCSFVKNKSFFEAPFDFGDARAMDTIGTRIRDYRKSRGHSQGALADAIGTSQENISSWERGRTQPSRENVRKIADALRIPPSDIEGDTVEATVQARFREVPVIAWVSAGTISDIGDLDAIRSSERLLIADLPGGEYFATTVRGDSMDRQSPDGSRVLVNASDRTPRPGRSYIFSLRGETTYKRYQSDPVVRFEPFSTNPSNQTIYPRSDRDWTVIGRVVRSWIDIE